MNTNVIVKGASTRIVGILALATTVGSARAEQPDVGAQGGENSFVSSVYLGGAVAFKPKYEGSKEYDVYALPIIIPRFGFTPGSWAGRFAVKGADDVRFRLIQNHGFEIGPLAGYAFGRKQDASQRLDGLGDIDGGLVVGGFAGYRIGHVLFDTSYHQQVTGGDAGYQIRLGAEAKAPINERIALTGRVGTTFASEDYMQTFFGVTGAQSARSGLVAYQAGSGLKDAHLEVGGQIKIDDRWMLKASARYARLIGDAADSPLIETLDQFSGTMGLSYRFDWVR